LAIDFSSFFLPRLVSKPSLPPSRQIVILLSGRSKRRQAAAAWRFCVPADLPLLVAPRSIFLLTHHVERVPKAMPARASEAAMPASPA
jgi:hypothetical protein